MNDSKAKPSCQTVALYAVYVLWCCVTNHYYVGVTHRGVKTRISEHRRGKKLFVDQEIQRIGWENHWDYWVVESGVPTELISEREQYWIKFFDCVYPKGYNKTRGGISNITMSDDTRAILRQRALERDMSGENHPLYGKRYTEEEKAKMRGRKHTEEEKAKMREKASKRDIRGENNPFYGKHHTAESNEKNRQAHLGKNKGTHRTEKTRAIIRVKALARHAAKRAAKAAKFAQAVAEVAKGIAFAETAQAAARAEGKATK